MVDYTIPTYSRPDLGFKVSDYVTKYYEDKEKEEAEEEETIVAEGPQQKYKADGKEYATWGQAEHARMYPGHQALANKAGFSGLFGPNAARPGNKSYDAMIDARKQDMIDIGLDLTHTTDGKRPNGWPSGHPKSNLSGKYSSDDFTTWMDLTGGVVGAKKKTTDTIPQTAAVTTDDATTTASTDSSANIPFDPVGKLKGLVSTFANPIAHTASYPGQNTLNFNQMGVNTTNIPSYDTGVENVSGYQGNVPDAKAWNELIGTTRMEQYTDEPTGILGDFNLTQDQWAAVDSASKPTFDLRGILAAAEAGAGGQVDVDLDADFDANQGFYE
jgi:hypothetical protein